MHSDPIQRLLLALILVALVVIAAQGGLRPAAAPTAGGVAAAPGGDSPGRYRVTFGKGRNPSLLRVDSATGRVEELMLKGSREWVVLGGSEASGGADADPEEEGPAAAQPGVAREERRGPVAVDADSELAALGEALGPGNPREMRLWAARVLGTYRDEQADAAVPLLAGVLEDGDRDVVIAAVRSLGSSTSERALPAVEPLVEHPDPDVQAAAREAVAALQ